MILRTIIIAWALLTLISCSSDTGDENENITKVDAKAEEIVEKSIEAHGGWEKWQNLKSISYTKTITLYDSSGAEESSINQYHSYRLKPTLSGVIWWLTEQDTIVIAYANGEAVRSTNSIQNQSPESKIAATKSFHSSYYVLFQPFKLKDVDTRLIYVGEETLEDGTEVNVVQPLYEGAKPGDDRWWYYFDKSTNRLVANMVNHPPTYSLINNLVYDTTTEILFNTRRKSYFVDSLRNIDYLRADYYYDNYRVEFDHGPNL